MKWLIKSLNSLITYLVEQGTVYAPVGSETIKYKKINGATDINLSRISDFSSKEIWQAMTHYYMKCEKVDSEGIEFPLYPLKNVIVMGLRPCDMKGLGVYEKVFSESLMFREFRENATFIGYLCETPGEHCFCESMGILPNSKENMDLVLLKCEEGYILSEESTKGYELMKTACFPEAVSNFEPIAQDSGEKQANIEDVIKKIDAISSRKWQQLMFACINCRICSYVCPTCNCFTITDEVFKNIRGRAIVWDSCQCRYFTREASGANPGSGKVERVKNRIFHKLKHYAQKQGEFMCTGCGRCIRNCPSGIEIIKEISSLKA
jgi:ferredoxin